MQLEDFIAKFPVSILVDGKCVSISEAGNVTFVSQPVFVRIHNAQGEQSLPVFTGEEEAERFLAASGAGSRDAVSISIHDRLVLLNTLKELREAGVIAKVAFNPERATGLAVRTWPVEIVIRGLESYGTSAN